MEKTLNIQKTITPSQRPSYDEWTELFNFGKAYDKSANRHRFQEFDPNSQYDFTKLFQPASKSYFSRFVDYLKFKGIW